MHPPPRRLRVPTLANPRAGNPLIARAHHLLPRQRTRRSHIDLPPVLARQREIARQHVQVPERHARREAGLGRGGDGGGKFEEAKVRDVEGAHANADEFDFGGDEAVAARVLAHAAVQVGEALEVFDFWLAGLVAHARVPAVKGLDEADDAAATVAGEGAGGVVLVVGDEVGAVAVAGLVGAQGDVGELALGDFEGGVDFDGVEVAVNFEKGGFGLRLQAGLWDLGEGQAGCADGDVEEAGEALDIADGGEVEVVPGAEVADVPPAVGGEASPAVDEVYGDGVDGRTAPGHVVIKAN